jgi:hypothetical protein
MRKDVPKLRLVDESDQSTVREEQNSPPFDPLEVVGRRIINIAADCIEMKRLADNDAERMRHLHRETEATLGEVLAHFRNIGLIYPAERLNFCVAKLMENALSVGNLIPALSESARRVVKQAATKPAREARARTPAMRAKDEAINTALETGAGRKTRNDPYALAKEIFKEVNTELQRRGERPFQSVEAIYKRLKVILAPSTPTT